MIKVRTRYILGIKPLLELLNDYFRPYVYREYVGEIAYRYGHLRIYFWLWEHINNLLNKVVMSGSGSGLHYD
jgi:hypothetical protein